VNPWQALLDVLGGVLNFFYQIIPNLGISIILLTLVIALLLFPLTLKQTRSMKAMQEIQPQVKALQKELKGDREELNKQLMELYKEKGVNPAAGCLPMIVQMPIWFGLFRVLRNPDEYIALNPGEALNSTFLGMDLTASPSEVVPDLIKTGDILGALPYIVLILVIVAAGFYQQMQMTARRKDDPNQQPQQGAAQSMQTAMKIMPLFFGFISWTLSAGLGIYFATSNIFRIGQQALIFRMDANKGDGGGKQPALPESPSDSGDEGTSSPSPNTSKKRNRRRKK
jgi:YidC/Oxa1 family membrane protein insertase